MSSFQSELEALTNSRGDPFEYWFRLMNDFHVHERHSGDAKEATAKDYCLAAEARGIDEIGFATHLIIAGPETGYGISPELIPEYFKEIESAQASTRVKLRIGLEVDYFPDEVRLLDSLLDEYPYDFILGSIHYVSGYDIGTRGGFASFIAGRRIEETLDIYYGYWREAIESGLFDVMVHPDYFRRPMREISDTLPCFNQYGSAILKAIDSLKSCGVGVEVNTSGYRHGVNDCYPILGMMRAFNKAGIETVTVGSDSHKVGQLGQYLEKAIKTLREAGYSHLCVFEGRRSHRVNL